jgi:hypothetical protein
MDTRRQCDGVRLQAYLGSILSSGVDWLRGKYPKCKIRNDEFNRSAIPELARRGLIYQVEARKSLPKGLPSSWVRLVKRQNGSPIWLVTKELGEKPYVIWLELKPQIVAGEIVWPRSR